MFDSSSNEYAMSILGVITKAMTVVYNYRKWPCVHINAAANEMFMTVSRILMPLRRTRRLGLSTVYNPVSSIT